MTNLLGQSLGRYHILEQLGEGGMATVYKAYDTRLERDVAIKIIRRNAFPPEQLERILKRFEREAKALAKLSHPNIVGVIDYGEHDSAPYLVLVYQPGGNLKKRMGQPMPWQEAVRLLIPVANALDYAHEHKVVHRDVKPANILLTEKNQPMLTDFGIAKILEMEDGHTLTGTGMGVGTPEYSAPEQGLGRQVDARADIYSLGIIFYELITGRKPYTADTPMAVILKHMTDPLPRPRQFIPNLPDAVERVLLKTLAKDPKDRYPDAGAFATAMENLISGNQQSALAGKAALGRRPDDNVSAVTIQCLSNEMISQIAANKKRENITKLIRQTVPVIGILAALAIVIALVAGINRYVNPPLQILPTYTPYPTLASPNNIFVAGQAGPIGQLIPPQGQPQILENGIFTVTENTRVEINQDGASIELADGSNLFMSAGTVFVFSKIQGEYELILESGSIMVRLNGSQPLSIKISDGFTAQVSGSLMGVQNSQEPFGVFVDCYEGHCVISGPNLPPSNLGEQFSRYIFYSAGTVYSNEDIYTRCKYWQGSIGQDTILSLAGNLCLPPPTPTDTPKPQINVPIATPAK